MIRLSRAAEAGLDHLDACLRPRAGAAMTHRVVGDILSATETLGRYAGRGRPGRQPGTRELVIPRLPYVVFHRIMGEDVPIRRVLHGVMQWPRPKRS